MFLSEARAGMGRREWEKMAWRSTAYWLVPRDIFSLLSCTIQDHLPKGGKVQDGLSTPPSLINETHTHTVLPEEQSSGNVFSIVVPSFQISLACIIASE